MKKVVRLNERELTRLIKNIVMENAPGGGQMCKAEDAKPGAGRPTCEQKGVTSGKLFADITNDKKAVMFLSYTNKETGCPSICKVNNNTPVTIS